MTATSYECETMEGSGSVRSSVVTGFIEGLNSSIARLIHPSGKFSNGFYVMVMLIRDSNSGQG